MQPKLSVIIPILNESDSIEPLIKAIHSALSGFVSPYEIIFVDDGSTDGSREKLEHVSNADTRVKNLLRSGAKSLSQSVIDGFAISRGEVLVVMDGDLQHHPKYIPALYQSCLSSDGVSVASRYVKDGKGFAKNPSRDLVSRFCTLLVQIVLGVNVSDPMTGYFAVRRDTLGKVVSRLSGVGYKILLEIIFYSSRDMNNHFHVGEIPFLFSERTSGSSKASVKIFFQFMCQVLALFLRLSSVEFVGFCIVGTIGVVVHLTVLHAALSLGVTFNLANVMALLTAATHNYLLNLYFTFSDIRDMPKTNFSGWILYLLAAGTGMVANTSIASSIHDAVGLVSLASISGIIVGIVWNYSASRFLLRQKS